MAEVNYVLGFWGLLALWPLIGALVSRHKQKQAAKAPPVKPKPTVAAVAPAPVFTVTAPPVKRAPCPSLRDTRKALGYVPAKPRVCGVCDVELPAVVVRTHDGYWLCSQHKAPTHARL